MIDYKIDVLEELKKAGFTTYKIRKENLLSQSAITQLKHGEPIGFKTLDNICWMLKCQPGDIIYYH